MKKKIPILIAALLFSAVIHGQTVLHTEGFETDGEGTRYTSNTYNDCSTSNNPDYFLRTNTNPVLPPTLCTNGFGNALTNLQGTWFWAGEDIRSNVLPAPGARPPGDLTTQSINITNYNALTVSLYLATASNNGTRWEWDDSITIKASLNNGTFFPVGRFVGGAPAGGDLREDLNLDGTADGAIVSVSNFTKYTFNIPGTGTTLKIKLDFDQYGGTEESAIDQIEVKGTLVLPIELLDFEVKKAGKVIDLNWSTAAEINNSYFAIERSGASLAFTEIGRVNATQSTDGKQTYFWTDEHPILAEMSCYRLRQYDRDGQSTVSPIVQVQPDHIGQIVSIAPNPVKGQAILVLDQVSEELVRITLYDLDGRVSWATESLLSKGMHSISIPMTDLHAGIYIIRVDSGGSTAYTKIVK